MAFIVDSYSESNANSNRGANPSYWIGQSFVGDGSQLTSAKFYIRKSGTPPPTGTVTVYIYAHTGTFGTNGTPTGSPLATSSGIDIATGITTSYQLLEFAFSGEESITLEAGTNYFVIIGLSGEGFDLTHSVQVALDSTSPTHDGNSVTGTEASWTPSSTIDYCFYVYGERASIATLHDNFNDNSLDTAVRWGMWGDYDAGVAETNNQLELTTKSTGAYFGIISDDVYDLTGSAVSVEVVNAGNQSLESFEAYPLTLTDLAEDNYVGFNIVGGRLNVYKRVSASSTKLTDVAYNSTNHRFLRIREASGTTYWDASADGVTWSNIHSVANPITVTALYCKISAGTWQAEASTTTMIVDNVNAFDTGAERDFEINGVLGSNAERDFEIHGIDGSYSERDFEIIGNIAVDSERDFEIIGVLGSNAERDFEVYGTDADNAERDFEIHGFTASNSERSFEVDANFASQRSFEVFGYLPPYTKVPKNSVVWSKAIRNSTSWSNIAKSSSTWTKISKVIDSVWS